MKLWSKRAGFEQMGKLESFLFTTAKNACLNHLRDQKRQLANQKQLVYLLEAEDEHKWLTQEIPILVYQHIYDEIAKLPEKMQAIIKMNLDGMKNEEIGLQLGIAEKTVRNLKTEAIKLLRIAIINKELMVIQLLFLCLVS
jgi:RNA polymerase sigma factor (sigma-70 family)